MKMYLVGRVWYSADQGDWPNTNEFPKFCTASLEEAKEKYTELAKENEHWRFGYSEAYIVEADSETSKFTYIEGGDSAKNRLGNRVC